MSRELMRKYMNLKFSRNLTDDVVAKRLGISRDKLISLKKQWGLNIRKQKDNVQGISEMDFRHGEKRGLSRRLILRRVRDYGWSVEKAINDPIDMSKSHKRNGVKNENANR